MTNRPNQIRLTRHAERDLERLRKKNRLAYDRAVETIPILRDDPHAGHPLLGDLSSCRSLEFSVKGSGQYRVVYTIVDAECVCVVFVIATHENVYDEAKRRADQVRRDPMGS